jgi:hypothetical protein
MSGAVITGAFVMASVGALYVLQSREGDYGRIFLKLGVLAGLISCIAQIFSISTGWGCSLDILVPVFGFVYDFTAAQLRNGFG